MTVDPNQNRGMSVTLKFPESARYKADNPWMVFHGSPASIREDIIASFGMDADGGGLTLPELVQEAQTIVTAMANAASGLGGRVLSEGRGKGSAWSQAQSGQRAEKAPEKSDAELEAERLLGEVEKVTSVADLQQLWARNQEAFKADALMAAYKARGKALSAA